ncbi:MAG: VWA domain-containing protein [Candidatus Symbiothrix sp.]|jgi:uncharacterized protein with von Willebrand factor type A (vWA) domain|nr:VWA domain-containing protein [Candidatus Symbiothrix sp.]
MSNPFDKFIHFGSIGNENIRKELAEKTFASLQNLDSSLDVSNEQTDNFADAIHSILNNETMRQMCHENEDLSEKITSDVLNFANKTKKLIDKTENPFENERNFLKQFEKTTENAFENDWKQTKDFISKIYDKQVLDCDFYEKEFALVKGIAGQARNDSKVSFDSVKEHFTEKWGELLFKKQTQWELEIIDRERKKFCEEFYKQIEELKKLQEALEPFTNELGRLWDMSKGGFQRVNFDILKRYAELLKNNKSLNDLAEMLGRMQQAEQEYEEELFADIQLKTEWKVESASKSDLIGVHESDDISSLLPSETALLADPTTQLIFYKKFAEKKLQTFEYEGRTLSLIDEEFQNKRQKAKEDAKGPFIICVDTSGSMHGTPETVAKTLCFAILKIAIRENRKCYLISFSTGIQTLNLTDLKNSLDKLIDFLSMSFHGGTDAAPAMHEALRMLKTEDYQKADLLVISDFVMPPFDELTQQQIIKAKENKTKFHSLVIGKSNNPAMITDFDNNWVYDINNPNTILTLVKNIYGI